MDITKCNNEVKETLCIYIGSDLPSTIATLEKQNVAIQLRNLQWHKKRDCNLSLLTNCPCSFFKFCHHLSQNTRCVNPSPPMLVTAAL